MCSHQPFFLSALVDDLHALSVTYCSSLLLFDIALSGLLLPVYVHILLYIGIILLSTKYHLLSMYTCYYLELHDFSIFVSAESISVELLLSYFHIFLITNMHVALHL